MVMEVWRAMSMMKNIGNECVDRDHKDDDDDDGVCDH